MSVILIKHHNESIYDATRKQKTYHKKEPRYVSKHRNKVVAEYAKVTRYSHRSMGVAEVDLPGPCQYLRKKTGIRYKANVDPVEKHPSRLEPVLPTATLLQLDKERREKLPPEKNFICVNKRKVICMKAKVPEERMVIHCQGESKDMSRGMEPMYVFKKDLGKMPKYLSRFIREDEKRLLLQKESEGTDQPKCRYITKDQREVLLKGLKDNWEEMQKTYQGLPILTDTIPKMLRKAKLEANLKQLEKDIVLLERHPYIYVYDDNDLNSC